MQRREDEAFKRAVLELHPVFAKAAAEYCVKNGLTVDLPYRQGATRHLVNPNETQFRSLFAHAFLDFCRRDGGTTARNYQRKAKKLREALAALDVIDPASWVLLYQWDFGTVIKPALEAQADAFERQAQEHGRYAKNITWERCVRVRFTGYPLPQAALVHDLAIEIEKALRPISRPLADKIKVTVLRDRREVRRLLRG